MLNDNPEPTLGSAEELLQLEAWSQHVALRYNFSRSLLTHPKFKHLLSLDLSYCAMTDDDVRAVAEANTSLRWLSIEGCTEVTQTSVQVLWNHPSLEWVNVRETQCDCTPYLDYPYGEILEVRLPLAALEMKEACESWARWITRIPGLDAGITEMYFSDFFGLATCGGRYEYWTE